jgi:hypothetical protein
MSFIYTFVENIKCYYKYLCINKMLQAVSMG